MVLSQESKSTIRHSEEPQQDTVYFIRSDHQPEEEYNLSRQNRPDTFSSWVIEDSYVSKTWVIESNPMFEGSLSSVRVAIYMRFVHANDYSLGL